MTFKTFFSKFKILPIAGAVYLASAPAVFAFVAAKSAEDIRCENFKTQFAGAFNWVPDSICTANGLVSFEIQAFLSIIGIISVLFIILGGFWYLTSAGNEEQAEKGRKTLTNAIIGLVVILLAVTIVRIVVNTLGLTR